MSLSKEGGHARAWVWSGYAPQACAVSRCQFERCSVTYWMALTTGFCSSTANHSHERRRHTFTSLRAAGSKGELLGSFAFHPRATCSRRRAHLFAIATLLARRAQKKAWEKRESYAGASAAASCLQI